MADLESLEALAREAGRAVKPIADRDGMGFVLMMFDRSPDRWFTYVSNSQRDDVVRMLQEFLRKLNSKTDLDEDNAATLRWLARRALAKTVSEDWPGKASRLQVEAIDRLLLHLNVSLEP